MTKILVTHTLRLSDPPVYFVFGWVVGSVDGRRTVHVEWRTTGSYGTDTRTTLRVTRATHLRCPRTGL